MISARHAWPAAVLLALSLVPTVRNVYAAPEPLPAGALDAVLPAKVGALEAFRSGAQQASWVARQFGTADYVSRRYRSSDTGAGYELFAARSRDGKKLYHFPEVALSYALAATSEQGATIGGLPARALEFDDGSKAAYVLFYDRQPVADPYRFELSILPRLFLETKRPMTLIYVRTTAGGATEAELRALLARCCEAFRS